jgi:predicted RNA-binding protein
MKYFINTVSRDHVTIGREAGIVQAGHGKKAPLQKLNKGDYVIFYSPKTSLDNGESLQAFTAVARIKDDDIYQVELSKTFRPFRKNAEYFRCEETPIRPLIQDLEFIENKILWGFKFRYGLFEISEHDFRLIISSMKAGIKD